MVLLGKIKFLDSTWFWLWLLGLCPFETAMPQHSPFRYACWGVALFALPFLGHSPFRYACGIAVLEGAMPQKGCAWA